VPVSICDKRPEGKVKCGDGRERNLQEKGEFKYFDYTGRSVGDISQIGAF
jgi:hypothetical protein